MQEYKIENLDVLKLRHRFHKLSEIHPYQTDEQFQALCLSIESDGVMVPITIWKNKVIDGRHRVMACESLGIKEIACKIIPYNTRLEEVRDIVMNSENRRHQDAASLSIVAFNRMKQEQLTLARISEVSGVSKRNISNVVWLSKHQPDIITLLFEGKHIKIGDYKTTRNLNAVVAFFKKEKATRVIAVDEELEKFLKHYELLSPSTQANALEVLKSMDTK